MDNTPTVTVNAHNATLLFAGLSPGSVGLYQFNVVILMSSFRIVLEAVT